MRKFISNCNEPEIELVPIYLFCYHHYVFNTGWLIFWMDCSLFRSILLALHIDQASSFATQETVGTDTCQIEDDSHKTNFKLEDENDLCLRKA
jgi:hypothetical protein